MSDNEASAFLAFASSVWHRVHGDDAHSGGGGGDGGGGGGGVAFLHPPNTLGPRSLAVCSTVTEQQLFHIAGGNQRQDKK